MVNFTDEPAKAMELLHKAIDLQVRALKGSPKNVDFQKSLVDFWKFMRINTDWFGKKTDYDSVLSKLKNQMVDFPDVQELVEYNHDFTENYARSLIYELGIETADFHKAVALLEIVLKTDPENIEALELLFEAQYRAGQYADVVTTIDKCIKLFPKELENKENPVHLSFLAMAHWQLGKKSEAEILYKRLTKSMQLPEFSEDPEYQRLYREATNLLYPMTIPEDPFTM